MYGLALSIFSALACCALYPAGSVFLDNLEQEFYDLVNLGARLERLTREYDARIIVSEFTYDKIRSRIKGAGNPHLDSLVFRELGSVRVKGKERSVSIYKVDA